MIQALAGFIVRLCITVCGLPAVSLEVRRAEASRAARSNVALAVGYRDDDGDMTGEAIEARGLGFGEYLLPTCDCGEDDDGEDLEDRGR